MDEPTSGLDSSTAYSLVLTLKKLAAAGRTIVTTIHQPSTDIFFKFDRVMVLSAGHLIYNGTYYFCISLNSYSFFFLMINLPTGPAKSIVPHFSKLNFKCPNYTNPCEYARKPLPLLKSFFFFHSFWITEFNFFLNSS